MILGAETKSTRSLTHCHSRRVRIGSFLKYRTKFRFKSAKYCRCRPLQPRLTLRDSCASCSRINLVSIWRVGIAGLAFLLAQSLTAQETLRDPVTGMEFINVPGGIFQMGCIAGDDQCLDREKPAHLVRLSNFWLGKMQVTQGQWNKIMVDNPSSFDRGDNYPVENVTWDKAQEFMRRLNSQGGQGFRLPTEAEWEYACRSGGLDRKYAWGSGDAIINGRPIANVADLSKIVKQSFPKGQSEDRDEGTVPVGMFPPNALGLHDMGGNVREWTQDAFGYYGAGSEDNPVRDSGRYCVHSGGDCVFYRVHRGAAWNDPVSSARCTERMYETSKPGYRVGLRLAKSTGTGLPATTRAGSTGAASAPVDAEKLIVAGERVGRIRLQMLDLEVSNLSLQSEGEWAIEPQVINRYAHLEVYFGHVEKISGQLFEHVVAIAIVGGLYTTKEGIRVGKSSLADVLAAYGQPVAQLKVRGVSQEMEYPGIEFWFDNGILSSIMIRPKAEVPLSRID
jgi:formylglycine-generating enzyme required for sulfatase activity